MSLSVILITKNEEAHIAACLESVAFADEIVVVDSGSTDRTVEIAQSLGAKVTVTADWPGFGPQKQRALDLATGDWVLSIDADERIPDALRDEILAATAKGSRTGFRLNRLSWFLGRPMRHGGWHPDRVLRLALRTKARFSDDIVHERLTVDGAVGDLKEPMLHYSYASVDDVLRKMRAYALATAAERRARGVKGGVGVAIARSLFGFCKAYVLRAGFLDGKRGFLAAVFKAQETFWRYVAVESEREG
ncbi:glycosyltransferase family 2 protein [Mesorhizobium sp. SP-1A]|uniref:glycosyltransferase family 2 protein n=1 Tax=Mesorhizobium sp. SP-1A TaxID=3077840 RepID=UPI0028F7262C|nr:glycosyltransferase family 2 protein [Mesorhizobium sp. SP-1A]